VEERLLECLDELRKAGDDVQRRRSMMQRSSPFKGLSKEWKALAMIGATREEIERPDSDSNKESVLRAKRVGRRGGRGKVRGLEDAIDSPKSVIDGKSMPPGYRLAVLIVQKNRMKNSWDDGYESGMESIRKKCEEGIHPVWGRMARESPLLAELGLFPVLKREDSSGDYDTWLEGSKIDFENRSSLREWLGLDVPFPLSLSQKDTIAKIRKDLIGKPRFERWEEWMSLSLSGLENDGALLEVSFSQQRAQKMLVLC